MTTDQIIRIVLKRVDSIVKGNFSYLEEAYDIRRDIYALLNDPIIRSEILNLKKEAMFRKKTDEIEKLIDERQKERKLLFEKISEARREYDNNTEERTVQLDLKDLNPSYEENDQNKEVFNTSELEGFFDEKTKNNQNQADSLLNSPYSFIVVEIENKKRELEFLQRELLSSSNINDAISKIEKITSELKRLYSELANKKSESNPTKAEEKFETVTENVEKKKRIQEKWGVRYHENMNENPEIKDRVESFKNAQDISEIEEPVHQQLQKKTNEKPDNLTSTENKMFIEENSNSFVTKEAIREHSTEEKSPNIKEEDTTSFYEKEQTQSDYKLNEIEDNSDNLDSIIEEKTEKERDKNIIEEPEIKTNNTIEEDVEDFRESKEEELIEKEPLNEEMMEEEVEKELDDLPDQSLMEKRFDEIEQVEEARKIDNSETSVEEEIEIEKEEEPVKKDPLKLDFEKEIQKMSKNLRFGILKMSFTKDQYQKLIVKFPVLEQIETKEKKGKIKFKFSSEYKKLLKK